MVNFGCRLMVSELHAFQADGNELQVEGLGGTDVHRTVVGCLFFTHCFEHTEKSHRSSLMNRIFIIKFYCGRKIYLLGN